MRPDGVTDQSARLRLLETLRANGVHHEGVLEALAGLDRRQFVHRDFHAQAWEDCALPIEDGQTISQPSVVGMMTQLLEPDSRAIVLEIGTGSGYQSMVLARLFRRVVTMERHAHLHKRAARRFREAGLSTVTALWGDGTKGWPKLAPFDRIMVTAAAPEFPQALMAQLKPGGVMVLPVGLDEQRLYVIRARPRSSRQAQGDSRSGEGQAWEQGSFITEPHGLVRFVPLVPQPARADSRA